MKYGLVLLAPLRWSFLFVLRLSYFSVLAPSKMAASLESGII